MQRFYQSVTVQSDEAEVPEFSVLLDEKPVRTPARQHLKVKSEPLARAIAAEWDAQGEQITPERMPMTQVAATALDRAAPDPFAYAEQIAAYGAADLLCYRADSPQGLVLRQMALWQPLLDWAALAFAAPLAVTSDVAPITQPPDSLRALAEAVIAHDPFEMAALGLATVASGSLIIALALSEGRVDAAAASEAGLLDELWQLEQWGADEEAESRHANTRADIEAAARFFDLHRSA